MWWYPRSIDCDRKFKTTNEDSENTPLKHPKVAGLELH